MILRDEISAAHSRKIQAPKPGPFLVVTAAFFWASLYAYPSILAPYLHDVGASLATAGLVIGSYGFTQTLVRIPAGILSDRLRNKKVFIIAGMILLIISSGGFFLTADVWLILVFRSLSGAAAAVWVHFTTLYMSYHDDGAASRALGNLCFFCYLCEMAAILAGSYLAQAFGWKYAFLLGLALAVPGLFFSLKLTESKSPGTGVPERKPVLSQFRIIGHDRLLFWTSILCLLVQLVLFATTAGFIPQYAAKLGADKAAIGWLSALVMLPRALASLMGGGFLARWFKLRSLVVAGFVLIGLSTCVLPLIHNLPLLFISQFISGIGSGFVLTILLALCTQTVPVESKSSAMGFFQSIYGIGMVAGPVMVGMIAQFFSLETGFAVVGTISLLSAVLTVLVI
jgi:MFS family permease